MFMRWIAGRCARIVRSPTAPERAAGLLDLDFYHPQLDRIGSDVNCWRLPRERDREFAFRIAVEIAARLNKLDADLDTVIGYDKER